MAVGEALTHCDDLVLVNAFKPQAAYAAVNSNVVVLFCSSLLIVAPIVCWSSVLGLVLICII